MCGIAGIVDPSLEAPELEVIARKMTETLVHRGPDEDGLFVDNGVALGIRRLSIIDVAGGHQPVEDESRQIHAVFNGEIYNFPELRRELEGNGHRFRTNSDTETIVHAYEESGDSFPSRLVGMFSIALWDNRRRRLVLVRDRLGKKPLYYACDGRRLLFGSEIKALLAADPTLAEARREAVLPYLTLGFIPEPDTAFRKIRKLPAAHQLIYERGSVEVRPYWSLEFDPAERPTDEGAVVEELRELLEQAVRSRLMSEVPLGVFLSGGLDSSTIVALAHELGYAPLKTFTMGFDRPDWDESEDARLVADHCKTDHHVLTLRERDLSSSLPDVVLTLARSFDEPFADSSALPTFHISRLAREHVTVILSGDGGDELFAGYTSYRGLAFAERYRRLPAFLRGALPTVPATAAAVLPAGRRYGAQRMARILRDSSLPLEQLYFSKISICNRQMLERVLTPEFLASTDAAPAARPAHVDDAFATSWPNLIKATYADLRFRLLEDMLVKVDRMSMAHSLEVRSPLLDHRLVEFVFNLPPELKLQGARSKAILRDAVSPYLPARTLRKPKQGFSVPLRSWLRGELREMASDYLARDGRLPADVFDHDGVTKVLSEHFEGRADRSAIIWALLSYAAWEDLYVRGRPEPAAAVL